MNTDLHGCTFSESCFNISRNLILPLLLLIIIIIIIIIIMKCLLLLLFYFCCMHVFSMIFFYPINQCCLYSSQLGSPWELLTVLLYDRDFMSFEYLTGCLVMQTLYNVCRLEH
jgi:hypothetical protein